MATAVERKRRRQNASPWKGPLQHDIDRHPWDCTRIGSIALGALDQRLSIEKKLWYANTLRRATEVATAAQKKMLRGTASLLDAIFHLLALEDPSDSGARVKEHALLALVNLVGEDEKWDQALCCDATAVEAVLHCGLMDDHVVVISAALQWLRRVSELPYASPIIVFTDTMFERILHLGECSHERLLPHIMSIFINITAHEKLQFVLARSTRLLHLLLQRLQGYGSSVNVERQCATHAAKCIANLLSWGGNCREMLRILPELPGALDSCHKAAMESDELAEASRIALEFLHDHDVEHLQASVARQFAEDTPKAETVRSPLLEAAEKPNPLLYIADVPPL